MSEVDELELDELEEMDVDTNFEPPSPVLPFLHSTIPRVFADAPLTNPNQALPATLCDSLPHDTVGNLSLLDDTAGNPSLLDDMAGDPSLTTIASNPIFGRAGERSLLRAHDRSLPSVLATPGAPVPLRSPLQARAFRCADCRRRFPSCETWTAHCHKYNGRCTKPGNPSGEHDPARDRVVQSRERRPYALMPTMTPGKTRDCEHESQGERKPQQPPPRELYQPAQPGPDDDGDIVCIDVHGNAMPPHVRVKPELVELSDDDLRDIDEVGAPTPEMPRRHSGACRGARVCAHAHAHNRHGPEVLDPNDDRDDHDAPDNRGRLEADTLDRGRYAGRGSKVLSAAVRANILALMLGRYNGRTAGPGAHIRAVTAGKLAGWEAITAAVGARPQDAERVRQPAHHRTARNLA
ncbi:hypothetical protein CspeluHIS016_0109910 [Cutaneotrichosporon spelunceum]|uniref:Uncharacterized protein n=1 Tax=Cutaneotrichosporon spelunceum TaxID=1672016 RepID=A0AAD3TPE5_9TREE|nr:hypothetical protein CspeluHIS016_0109910 [Cutaneotrichosporon spelunceum]